MQEGGKKKDQKKGGKKDQKKGAGCACSQGGKKTNKCNGPMCGGKKKEVKRYTQSGGCGCANIVQP